MWDLKVLFGEYSDRAKLVNWHTAITVPWGTAKLLAYFLQVNIAIYEELHERIRIAPSVLPPTPPPPSETEESSTATHAIYNRIKVLHAQLTEGAK